MNIMRWEKLSDQPRIYRHNERALWLADVGGHLQILSLPQASVSDVLKLLQEIDDIMHPQPDMKRAAQR
jgi:hypothetical protein